MACPMTLIFLMMQVWLLVSSEMSFTNKTTQLQIAGRSLMRRVTPMTQGLVLML